MYSWSRLEGHRMIDAPPILDCLVWLTLDSLRNHFLVP